MGSDPHPKDFRPDKYGQKRLIWGKLRNFIGPKKRFTEENPISHQIYTTTSENKSKPISMFFYRIFSVPRSDGNLAKIYIDFFISIVYDKIAKYGMPINKYSKANPK